MKDPDPVPEAVRAQLERLLDSPALFLRDIDPVRRRAVLAPMTEASYRASSFLDTRIRRAGDREMAIPLDTLLRLVAARRPAPARIDYIFHIGHCGSSLISRLLGELPEFLALREPPLLMGLARSRRRLDEPDFPISSADWDALLELSLVMLGRTWRPGQRALVKPTSHVANLIPILMRFTNRERALLNYLDLETYLAVMLRPGVRQETRLYAEDFRLRDFTQLAPDAANTLAGPSDARLAAMNWLLQTREFAMALDDPGLDGRMYPVEFESFLQDPTRSLAAICQFLGAETDQEVVAALLAGPAATRHAKSPDAVYDSGRRQQEIDVSRVGHAEEIADGLAWAGSVCASCDAFAGLIDRFSQPTEPPALP